MTLNTLYPEKNSRFYREFFYVYDILTCLGQALRSILITSSSTAAPAKAVMISLTIPVPIEMCSTLNSQPPMKAPMIPTMTVPMQPVWIPPINHSASSPAMI